MLASREFMTSVVVGKDVVPRIGMHQLETLRLGMNTNSETITSTTMLIGQARPDGDDQEVGGEQMDDNCSDDGLLLVPG